MKDKNTEVVELDAAADELETELAPAQAAAEAAAKAHAEIGSHATQSTKRAANEKQDGIRARVTRAREMAARVFRESHDDGVLALANHLGHCGEEMGSPKTAQGWTTLRTINAGYLRLAAAALRSGESPVPRDALEAIRIAARV